MSLSLSAFSAHVGGALFGIVTARLFQRHLNGAALAYKLRTFQQPGSGGGFSRT